MAISNTPRQGELAVLYSRELVQTAFGVPRAAGDLTLRLAAENLSWPATGLTFRDILTCDNQAILESVLEKVQGAMQLEFWANSADLGWIFALGFGTAGAPGAVAAGNEVQTETVTATGGTEKLEYDGRRTAPFAYNANAAARQAALEAVVGSGNVAVAGTGPYAYTFQGSLASSYVKRLRVVTSGLTGGSSSIAVTTPGGPARKSYAITLSTSLVPKYSTFIFAFAGDTTGFMVSDAAVNSIEVRQESAGLYRVTAQFVHNGQLEAVSGLTIPACASPRLIQAQESKLLMGSVDATEDVESAGYTFGNELIVDDGYTLASPYLQRLERADLRPHRFAFEINQTIDQDVWDLCNANGLRGTEVSLQWQVGSASDGATIAGSQTDVRFDGTMQQFGGPANRARIPVIGQPKARTADASRPVAVTVITEYADGYLATS